MIVTNEIPQTIIAYIKGSEGRQIRQEPEVAIAIFEIHCNNNRINRC